MPTCVWASTTPGKASRFRPSKTWPASAAGISGATRAKRPSTIPRSSRSTAGRRGRTTRTFLTTRSRGGLDVIVIGSHDGDRLDLDQVVGVRQRADLDHRGGRPPDTEELVADHPEVGPVANVGHVRGDLDHAGERAAARLHESLDGAEHLPGLALEITAVRNAAVLVVGDLAGQEQDRLGAGHLDRLAVAGWIVDAGRAVLLELGHGYLRLLRCGQLPVAIRVLLLA